MLRFLAISLSFHGMLLGLCSVMPAQVDVTRDVSAPLELHVVSEESSAHNTAVPLPPTGEERDRDRAAPTPHAMAIASAAAPFVAGEGAFIKATPLPAQNVPPRYPWLARVRGWEGTVVVGARVGADGRVISTWIAQSSGHAALDTAAHEAIRVWTFTPASRLCVFVASELVIPIRFRLIAGQGEVTP